MNRISAEPAKATQEGPNQLFEIFAHLGYGALLAPFVLDFARAPAKADATRPAATPKVARA